MYLYLHWVYRKSRKRRAHEGESRGAIFLRVPESMYALSACSPAQCSVRAPRKLLYILRMGFHRAAAALHFSSLALSFVRAEEFSASLERRGCGELKGGDEKKKRRSKNEAVE